MAKPHRSRHRTSVSIVRLAKLLTAAAALGRALLELIRLLL